MSKRLIAGCMSGTSADGVDCAIVEIEGRGLSMTAKPLSHAYEAFSPELRKQILDVRQRGEVRLADLAEIGRLVTLAHVPAFKKACEAASVSASQIAAIAAHGQTLFHGPPNTIQYFDPSLLAFETGCAMVSDFRRADLAAGGQGAPLVPFADWILFRHPAIPRAILNIGGIANVTYLKPGGSMDEVIAYDTGPGNCISDWLMQTYGNAAYDAGGALALRGSASDRILDAFLLHPYFKQKHPKSTDGPTMIAAFSEAIRSSGTDGPLENLLKTAAVATAKTIVAALNSLPLDWLEEDDFELYVTGGGVRNEAMQEAIFDHFSGLRRAEDLGIRADSREAIAFALLGAATLDGEPSNVPSATGASRRVVLGSITPKPI